jgi:hypothetical protein
MDGFTWRGSTFICSQKIDGPTSPHCDFDAEYDSRPPSPDLRVASGYRAPVIHSLFDMARPAKSKGVLDYAIIHEPTHGAKAQQGVLRLLRMCGVLLRWRMINMRGLVCREVMMKDGRKTILRSGSRTMMNGRNYMITNKRNRKRMQLS